MMKNVIATYNKFDGKLLGFCLDNIPECKIDAMNNGAYCSVVHKTIKTYEDAIELINAIWEREQEKSLKDVFEDMDDGIRKFFDNMDSFTESMYDENQ